MFWKKPQILCRILNILSSFVVGIVKYNRSICFYYICWHCEAFYSPKHNYCLLHEIQQYFVTVFVRIFLLFAYNYSQFYYNINLILSAHGIDDGVQLWRKRQELSSGVERERRSPGRRAQGRRNCHFNRRIMSIWAEMLTFELNNTWSWCTEWRCCDIYYLLIVLFYLLYVLCSITCLFTTQLYFGWGETLIILQLFLLLFIKLF